ncbi:N(4)-(Beta-N-acetylglucosaminyl)-L-asparaginase precursor [Planctomycetes bacterium Poly30]|uniref:N(4)-(Beta-N-acetylglucosaminyl)-L-asparaginase n=1 Tax=Saltatorellus ferox TaxID=2528018 RepID=A0A518EQ95_9BACT|nr:N(4)-(Beta-N-acetylglucosaminyl)-L-asparaginase precursor [Planctomycetes bacterium Poly30]
MPHDQHPSGDHADRNSIDPLDGPAGSPSRRTLLRGAAAAAAGALTAGAAAGQKKVGPVLPRPGRPGPGGPGKDGPRPTSPVLIGSANALPGMQRYYTDLQKGAEPLDVAIEVVKIAEADPADHSVGLGGLPDEDGNITLDAACMHGPTHNSGAVACIKNILHPSEVARLVMERTDHCLIVDQGAYRFARDHGHPHTDLMTEETRRIWMQWKESMSDRDDRLPPRKKSRPLEEGKSQKSGMLIDVHGEKVAVEDLLWDKRITGTIHCSALSAAGEVACTTTTSGLSWKIPGRVGDSPIVGAGLYCDQEVGSAGGTGRGESAILANASFAVVELMRQGASPREALREVLHRVERQALRMAQWQPALVDAQGQPTFDLQLYCVNLQGETAGMSLKGQGSYAVADAARGPRLEKLEHV